MQSPDWQATPVHPVEVTPASRVQRQNEKFRVVIGMLGENQCFQRWQSRFPSFQNQQDFRSRFNFPLPPVMRFDAGNEVCAGNQACLQCRLGQRPGGFQIRCREQDDGGFRGGIHCQIVSPGAGRSSAGSDLRWGKPDRWFTASCL